MCCLENADAGLQRQDKMTQKILAQKPEEDNQTLWNWSYRRLLAVVWGQGTEPGSSTRAGSVFNCRAVCPFSLLAKGFYDIAI